MKNTWQIELLASPRWQDYELLDSGDGQKLERFGTYTFVRPEAQALWKPRLPARQWNAAEAVFIPSGEESGGHWKFRQAVPEKWKLDYPLPLSSSGRDPAQEQKLTFQVMTTPGRHLGVFPECAAHWDWLSEQVVKRRQGLIGTPPEPAVNVLNLFAYTGLASLAAAAAGARVTHVDASRKSVTWGRLNQELSGLEQKPIRWIVDDTLKFVQREARRGVKYDGILLDPPKFGRGPKGEVWEVFKSLPELLHACRQVISARPLFVVLTIYAVRLSAIHAGMALEEMMTGAGGTVTCGELVTAEKSAGRMLSQAVYARWSEE